MNGTLFGLSQLLKKRPRTKLGRTLLGVVLVLGGLVGFLPVVGFWMIPLGLVVLSHDFPSVRSFRRRWTVILMRRWNAFRDREERSFPTRKK